MKYKKIIAFILCLAILCGTRLIDGGDHVIAEVGSQSTAGAVNKKERMTTGEPGKPEPAKPEAVKTEGVNPEPAKTEPAKAETVKPENHFLDHEEFLKRRDESLSSVRAKTVPMTKAGSLILPRALQAARNRGADTTDVPEKLDGLYTNKKVEPTEKDGEYLLTLEAYTTGKVKHQQTPIPLDIVLVLDQSGSMNNTFSEGRTAQQALTQAVEDFLKIIAEDYDAKTTNHRVSMVKFYSTYNSNEARLKGEIMSDWVALNESGARMLTDQLKQSKPYGLTPTDLGMKRAEELLTKRYPPVRPEELPRQKVVILFTDGKPEIAFSSEEGFGLGIADRALAISDRLKKAGTTIYTIGIYRGADPSVLSKHNTEKDSWGIPPRTLLYYWAKVYIWGEDGNSYGSPYRWVTQQDRAMTGWIDIPMVNRFMNFMSSDYENASSLSAKRTVGGNFSNPTWWEQWTGYKRNIDVSVTWETDGLGTKVSDKHYLTADNAEGLKSIFKSIAVNIATPKIALGEESVMTDVISPYFTLTEDPAGIKVYTADRYTDYWKPKVESKNLKAVVDGKKISVTGFDFDKNVVTEEPRGFGTNLFYGRKLILEIKVKGEPEFIGGNNVPTNATGTGLYKTPTDTKPVAVFDEPKVNVPIKPFEVRLKDKDTYYKHPLTKDRLMENAVVTMDGKNPVYQPDDWRWHYVKMTPTVLSGAESTDGTRDATYRVHLSIVPKEEAKEGSVGTPVTPFERNAEASLSVFKPELTFRDEHAFYGEDLPDLSGNPVQTVWRHGNRTSADEGVDLPEEPVLHIVKTPAAEKLIDGKVGFEPEIPVAVTVDMSSPTGKINIDDVVTLKHQPCDPPCDVTESTPEKAFVIHTEVGELTIRKVGGTVGDTCLFTVYRDGKPYSEAVIIVTADSAKNREILHRLPVGTYTVKEDGDWSWRYRIDNGTSVTLNQENKAGEITCTNSPNEKKYWLNGYSVPVFNLLGQAR